MPAMANCALEGYGALPSAPRNFHFSNIGTTIGLLHWDTPFQLADSVSSYRVTYQAVGKERPVVVAGVKSPYVLEDLMPNTSYEVRDYYTEIFRVVHTH